MTLRRNDVARPLRPVAAAGTTRLELSQFRGLARLDTAGAGRAIPAGFEWRAAGLMAESVGRVGARAPVGQEAQGAGEFAAVGGQLVGEPKRTLRVRACHQHTLTLKALEPIGQDVRGDSGQRRLKVVEAARAIEQGLDDEQAPAVADPIERRLEWGRGRLSGHAPIVASSGLARSRATL